MLCSLKNIVFILLLHFVWSGELCSAQPSGKTLIDTLHLTIDSAEKIFLKKNAVLLASQYNISAERALILQAKLYPNPYFSYTNSIYNNSNKKYFDFSSEGDNAPTLSQLILLAGKRKKQIGMAETNSLLAEDQYLDLLRTLKYTLRSDFFSIYYLQQTLKVYDEEIDALKKIVSTFEKQLSKGYIAKTEVLRVQAQLYNLQSEYNDLINQINDKESEVRTLLDTLRVYIVPVIDTAKIVSADPTKFTLTTLLDSAAKNRPDLKFAQHNLMLSEQNYKYQKALAAPDITFSPGFVQHSNFISNDFTYAIAFSVPLFNRNQGNIKAAGFQIKANEANLKSVQVKYEEDVYRALEKAITQYNLYKSFDKNFLKEFSALAKSVLDNYMKRNIGLLDFLNFYDSYKQNAVQFNSILNNLSNAYQNINYMTGTDFF